MEGKKTQLRCIPPNQKQNGWSHESPNHHTSVPASPSLRERVSHQPKWTQSQPIIPHRLTLTSKTDAWVFISQKKSLTNALQSPHNERKPWAAIQRQQCIGLENQPSVPGTKFLLVLFIVLSGIFLINKKSSSYNTTQFEVTSENTTNNLLCFVGGLSFIFGTLMKSDLYITVARWFIKPCHESAQMSVLLQQ